MNIYASWSDSIIQYPLGSDLNRTIIGIDIANSGIISICNRVVNMIRLRANLPGVDFFFRGLSTRTISPLFTVSQPVSSSIKLSSNKIVICEVLLGVR